METSVWKKYRRPPTTLKSTLAAKSIKAKAGGSHLQFQMAAFKTLCVCSCTMVRLSPGTATLSGEAFVPPEHKPFLKVIQIRGAFTLSDVRFAHLQTQQAVNSFSQRASGTAPRKKETNSDAEAPMVASVLKASNGALAKWRGPFH